MIAKERQKRILELLEAQQIVTIRGLAEQFSVAVITVRRDLDVLEKAGLIRKVYGGAVLAEEYLLPPQENARYALRAEDCLEEKRAIASAAADLIAEGEIIFLDTGTAVSALAKQLRNRRNLTVVTNSLAVIHELLDSSVQLFCVGGWVGREQCSFASDSAIACLEGFCFDHCFCGAGGISAEKGVTDYRHEIIQQRKTVLSRSASAVLLTDSRKFETTAPFVVCPASAFCILITDSGIPESQKAMLEDDGVRVLVADARR